MDTDTDTDTDTPNMIDITGPEHVEIALNEAHEIIWVNVDGICRLRICKVKHLVIEDMKAQQPHNHDNHNGD